MMKILIIIGCILALLTVILLAIQCIAELKRIGEDNDYIDIDKLAEEQVKKEIKEEDLDDES